MRWGDLTGVLVLLRRGSRTLSFGLTYIRKNIKGRGFFGAVEFFSLSLSHEDALVWSVSYRDPKNYRVNEDQ